MKKAEMVKRIKELQEMLSMDTQDWADKYNAEHDGSVYKMKPSDAYPYMVGWVKSEINYILTH